MTREEAIREIIARCGELVEKTHWCQARIEAFLGYYLRGDGIEPKRDSWPDRVLNPKLNGTSVLLKHLRDALGCFLPQTLPDPCVRALDEFVAVGTDFVSTLEDFHRLESLNVSYTSESDIFSYMTMQCADMTFEWHRQNLKAKFKAMKNSFFENARGAFSLTNRIIECSRYYHPPKTRMRTLAETLRLLESERAAPAAAHAHDVSLSQAAMLLRKRCEMENLADFAVCERTFRRWERGGASQAGYTSNCRTNLQAYMAWMDGYVIACRAHVAGKTAIVRYNENREAHNRSKADCPTDIV